MGRIRAGVRHDVFLYAVIVQNPTMRSRCCLFVYLHGNFAAIQIKLIKLIKITTVTNLNYFRVP